MIELLLFVIGGVINFINFYSRASIESPEKMPYKNQGYTIAFIMGALTWGGIMNLVYWIAK
jgi:hypothetical protein